MISRAALRSNKHLDEEEDLSRIDKIAPAGASSTPFPTKLTLNVCEAIRGQLWRASVKGSTMKTIYDDKDLREILASPIDEQIKEILRQKIELVKEFLETFDLADLMFIVLVDPGDSLEAIRKELGFCPLTNQVDGARYPSPAYQPSFEHAVAHGTIFELVFCMSDSGLADVVLVPDRIGIDQTLREFCRTYATPAS